MTPELQQQVRRVFAELVELPERQRLSYLRKACSGQPEVMDEVLRLLEAHDNGPSFLKTAVPRNETEKSERIGRFIISGVLGRGSMGTVYAAHDPRIGRKVALKTIDLRGDDCNFLQDRLLREAKSAGALSHPGIVTIYDIDVADGKPFIAMEFVDGKSLQDLLNAGTRFTTSESLDIVRQTAEALDFAHAHEIVHRDIKPANIMRQKDGVIKVTDFGIAKIKAPGLTSTQTNVTLGTPVYMSPEQFTGAGVDGRSDQHSLAVLAFQLLTGELPFKSEAIHELAIEIVSGERPSVRSVNPALPESLDEPLHRAMAKLPADRFPTCRAFVQALTRSATTTPVVLPGPTNDTTERTPGGRAEPKRATQIPEPEKKSPAHFPNAIGWVAAAILALVAAGLGLRNYLSRDSATNPNLLPAIVQFTAEPATVKPGDPVTLRWEVSDAVRVIIDHGVGKKESTGSVVVKPSTTTQYTLTASGGGAEKSAIAVANVDTGTTRPPEPVVKIVRFRAEPAQVAAGHPFQLKWTVTGTSKVSIDPGGESVQAEGALERTEAETTTYTLTATPESGGAPVIATVRVPVSPAANTEGGKPAIDTPKLPTKEPPTPEKPLTAGAMLDLGKSYLTGAGKPPDPVEAIRWLRKAADAGSTQAMMLLGALYSDGKLVGRSGPEALSWFRKAAEAGDKRAMDNAGDMYWTGRLVEKNPAEALSWHKRAAEAGNPTAIYHLGNMYEQGSIVPRNVSEAKRLYKDAEALGNDDARTALARLQAIPAEDIITLTGIQPPYIEEGRMRQYTVLGSGLSLKTTVSLDVPGFVGSRQDKQDFRPSEAASNGSWLKLFIYIDRQPTGRPVRIGVRSPGSREAYLNVPLRR